MSDLFASSYKHSLPLSALFTKCTSLELHPADGGPQLICASCLSNLIISHEFREQCFATSATLRLLCVKLKNNEEDERNLTRDNLINKAVELETIERSTNHDDDNCEIISNNDLSLKQKDVDLHLENIHQSDSSNEEDNDVPLNQLPRYEKISNAINDSENLSTETINSHQEATDTVACRNKNHSKINQENKILLKHNVKESETNTRTQLVSRSSKTSKKRHKCKICHKCFQQSCTLKDHIRTHNGEAPFLCSQCGKSFNNPSNLRQHVWRHTGIKPYKCTECPMEFTGKGIY